MTTIGEMREDIEERMGFKMFPSIGCEIVLAITPARLYDIAERLEPAIPQDWELVSQFHRELDNGRELYFHRIETRNDRVPVPRLLEFGDRYTEIDEQLNIEQAKQDAPEEFEKAVDSLGREKAIEMFAGLGGSGANLVQLRSVSEENRQGAKSEVLLRVDLRARLEEDEARSMIARTFMGKMIRVEKVGDSEFLLGGDLAGNVEQVRRTLDELSEVFDIRREKSAIVCRSIAV